MSPAFDPWHNGAVSDYLDSVRELKRLAALERGAFPPRPAACAVALVYPDSYFVGMSSLGFQFVYALLNSLPDVRAERAFFSPRLESRTVESRAPLGTFDLVAFSLSCEQNYGNAAAVLRGAGIPPFARERDERFPLIVGGGVCASLNPEPLADLFDLFVLGEAEEILGPLFERLLRRGRTVDRGRLLRSLAEIPGVYVPRLFVPRLDGEGRIAAVEPVDASVPRPSVRRTADLDRWPALAPVIAPETDFGGKALVEVSRGCGRACRFCVADYAYRPPRTRSRAALSRAIRRGRAAPGGVALLGASLSDLPWTEQICAEAAADGGRVSVSSVRADALSDALLRILAGSGAKSITIAPETPAERLQRRVNKSVSAREILSAAERAAAAGIRELKLYYLVGIPGENDGDLDAIGAQVAAAASRIPARVSVGCLVPKAATPLQWAGMEEERALRKKFAALRGMLARIPRVRVSGMSAREALLEGALARGDRSLARHLAAGERIPREAITRHAVRPRGADEIFPWDHLDTGVSKSYLRLEFERFMRGEMTAPCAPASCRACGACGDGIAGREG